MYDVFISYNWGIKTQVRQLYEVLKSLSHKVWMDETDLNAGNSPLTAELLKIQTFFLAALQQTTVDHSIAIGKLSMLQPKRSK